MNSNWTGRTARTLFEAFGPHTSERIEPDPGWTEEPGPLLIAAALAVVACWLLVWALFEVVTP